MQATMSGIEHLDRQMIRLGKFTKKGAKDLVTITSIKFIQSARSRSVGGGQGKRTKNYRDLIKNPNAKSEINQYDEGGAEYLIRVLHQGKAPTFIPTNNPHKGKRGDPRLKIKRKRLLSQSWGWMLPRFGKTMYGGSGRKLRRIRGVALVDDHRRDVDPSVVLRNRLKYGSKVQPGLVDEAARAAARGIDGNLKRMARAAVNQWA